MFQTTLTPAAGKRLIAKAVAAHPAIRNAMLHATLVIVAGTTNGYIAEELLVVNNEGSEFNRHRFFRGITLPPHKITTETGRLPDEKDFPGDVVLVKGLWQKGKTIMDVSGTLKEGDIILKGANALDMEHKRAAILIGHPAGGTIMEALKVVVGKRVQLILPVGLEKRIYGDLDDLSARLNKPGNQGPRLLPVSGTVISEIEAIAQLTGAQAEMTAAGGVCGAEGAVWLAISGTPQQEKAARELLTTILKEPAFTL